MSRRDTTPGDSLKIMVFMVFIGVSNAPCARFYWFFQRFGLPVCHFYWFIQCFKLLVCYFAFGSLYDAFIGIFNRDRAVLGLCTGARLVLCIGAPSYLTQPVAPG